MLSASEYCTECSYSAFVETNNCGFGIMKRVGQMRQLLSYGGRGEGHSILVMLQMQYSA